MLRALKIARRKVDYADPRVPPAHADLFLERYAELLGWAQLLTEDRQKAQDLLHDAFVQFNLCSPSLDEIGNLDGYLRRILRNLHLAKVRRALCVPMRSFSILDYDSAEMGLCTMDASAQIQARDELRVICQYACVRKETSKAGSILILRYFHGYYPTEIAQVVRSTRPAVDERLRQARSEAQIYLHEPDRLTVLTEANQDVAVPIAVANTGDCTTEFRHAIFLSRKGECLSPAELRSLYIKEDAKALTSERLAHIVSCPTCLDEVNRLLSLPLLAERHPNDTLDPDQPCQGGPGGGASADDESKAAYLRRSRAVYEHHPQELFISVNGYPIGSQKISAGRAEQNVSVNIEEPATVVEVFSHLGVRLLMLNVTPLPDGSLQQSTHVRLSEGRSLDACLDLGGYWPSLSVTYHDPSAAAAVEPAPEWLPEAEPENGAVAASTKSAGAMSQLGQRLTEWWGGLINDSGYWMRPAAATATILMIILGALLVSHRSAKPLSATRMLADSAVSEQKAVASSGKVTHRTISIEEIMPDTGEVVARRRLELWQHPDNGAVARRVYDAAGRLMAGEWQIPNKAHLQYRDGKLRAASIDNQTVLSPQKIWLLSPSAKQFAAIARPEAVTVEEHPDVYVLHYSNNRTGYPTLLSASITLRRPDLHAVEQTLQVEQNGQVTNYRFVESAYEQRPISEVGLKVFDVDPELAVLGSPEAKVAAARIFTPTPTVDLHVDLLARLDHAGALAQDHLKVVRGPTALSVEGVVDTSERKRDILQALGPTSQNSAVKLSIAVAAEAEQKELRQHTGRLVLLPGEVKQKSIPAAEDIRKYFSTKKGLSGKQLDEDIKTFCNDIVDRSSQIQSHVLVLKQVVETFSSEDIGAMSPAANQQWRDLVHRHTLAVLSESVKIRQELEEVFGSNRANANARPVDDAGQALSNGVTALADASLKVDRMLWNSLALSSDEGGSVPIKSTQFWISLDTVERLARDIANRTGN